MAKEYLERLSRMMVQIEIQLPDDTSLEFRHFFSGAAVYVNNRICLTLTPAGFALKLPEEARTYLLDQQGAKSQRYFAKGPLKKDYVVLPDGSLDDIGAWRKWIQLSVDYALSLPEKTRGRRNVDTPFEVLTNPLSPTQRLYQPTITARATT